MIKTEQGDVSKVAAKRNVWQKLQDVRMCAKCPNESFDVSLLNEILQDLENNRVTPTEAITRAGEIYSRYQGRI